MSPKRGNTRTEGRRDDGPERRRATPVGYGPLPRVSPEHGARPPTSQPRRNVSARESQRSPPRSLSLVDPTTPERISHSRGISPYRRGRKPRVARSSQPASIDAALETRPSEIRLKGRIRCWDDDPTQRRCRTVPPPFRRTDMQGGGTNRRRTTGSGRSLATSTRNPASFRGIFAVSASGSP